MTAMRDRGERSPGMIVVGERGISRTVADADGYTHGYLGGGDGEGGGDKGKGKRRVREGGLSDVENNKSEDLMLTAIKINGQSCTLTCHLIPPCVILID